MQQINSQVQRLAISNNAQNPDIDERLRKVSLENDLPGIELIHYANMWFNLYNSPNFTFQPSEAVKESLLLIACYAKSHPYTCIKTDLSASDTAALFYILNSFQAYEKETKGELAIFPKVVFNFEQAILKLCNRDEEKARKVLDALISFNNPSNDALIEKMRSSIMATAKSKVPLPENIWLNLPEDIWLEIFKNYLLPSDLASVAQVCRKFRRLSYDNSVWNVIEKRLLSIYPSMRVIGPEAWEKYVDLERFGLTLEQPALEQPAVAGAAPSSKRASLTSIIVRMLHQVAPKVERNAGVTILSSKRDKVFPIIGMLHHLALKIEKNAGVTILTIPKGLTFNKLVEIARSPKQGNPTGLNTWDFISDKFGDIPVEKTYRVVITSSVLRGTRFMSMNDQQKLVRDLGYEMPGLLEASTLAILTDIIFSTHQTRHLRNMGLTTTSTMCWQQIKINGANLIVGSGSASFYTGPSYDVGAMVMRKL